MAVADTRRRFLDPVKEKLMKRLAGLLTMTTLLCCIPCGAAAQEPQNRPEVIADPSAGDWIVDRFAGNSTAGPRFFQGPAREVGGLGRPEFRYDDFGPTQYKLRVVRR